MKPTITIALCILISSCIPYKTVPGSKKGRVLKTKNINPNLPRGFAFTFHDPKEPDEFYKYINTIFKLNNPNIDTNIPFTINGKDYYFSFYESEVESKTLNLIPILVDAKLEQDGFDSRLFQDTYTTRWGTNWNIVITVTDDYQNDCLHRKYYSRDDVINYLKKVRTEYLSTDNYYEILFKK